MTELKRVRRARGMRQLDLAYWSGLSQAQVSLIESGRLTPTRMQAERLARVLGLSAEELQTEARDEVPVV